MRPFPVLRLDVHHHVDRLVERPQIARLIVKAADLRIWKSGRCQGFTSLWKFARLKTCNPAGDNEIGLESID